MIFKYPEMRCISLKVAVCDFYFFLETQMRYLLRWPKNALIENLFYSAAVQFKHISPRPIIGPRELETGLSVNALPGGSLGDG